jgi:hypothetical protein
MPGTWTLYNLLLQSSSVDVCSGSGSLSSNFTQINFQNLTQGSNVTISCTNGILIKSIANSTGNLDISLPNTNQCQWQENQGSGLQNGNLINQGSFPTNGGTETINSQNPNPTQTKSFVLQAVDPQNNNQVIANTQFWISDSSGGNIFEGESGSNGQLAISDEQLAAVGQTWLGAPGSGTVTITVNSCGYDQAAVSYSETIASEMSVISVPLTENFQDWLGGCEVIATPTLTAVPTITPNQNQQPTETPTLPPTYSVTPTPGNLQLTVFLKDTESGLPVGYNPLTSSALTNNELMTTITGIDPGNDYVQSQPADSCDGQEGICVYNSLVSGNYSIYAIATGYNSAVGYADVIPPFTGQTIQMYPIENPTPTVTGTVVVTETTCSIPNGGGQSVCNIVTPTATETAIATAPTSNESVQQQSYNALGFVGVLGADLGTIGVLALLFISFIVAVGLDKKTRRKK